MSWLKEIQEVRERIDKQCMKLNMLAKSFEIIGNIEIANKIFNISDVLLKEHDLIYDIISKDIDNKWKQTQEAIASTIKSLSGSNINIVPTKGHFIAPHLK